ncbi:MAG: hypothetical protein K0R41_3605 [Geminicoccaceae bacterium]|nr:hypothetical protein [Geminicoccaceae bacterium]
MVNWRERIAIDPQVLGGKPVVKGTRLSVEFVVGLLAEGWTEQQLLARRRTSFRPEPCGSSPMRTSRAPSSRR